MPLVVPHIHVAAWGCHLGGNNKVSLLTLPLPDSIEKKVSSSSCCTSSLVARPFTTAGCLEALNLLFRGGHISTWDACTCGEGRYREPGQ